MVCRPSLPGGPTRICRPSLAGRLAVVAGAGFLAVFLLGALLVAPVMQLSFRARPSMRAAEQLPAQSPDVEVPHNCRFWGLIGADYSGEILSTHLIDGGLQSLRDLGGQNYDGWAFAYYLPESHAVPLNRPIFRRGGPPAPEDEDYLLAVEEMLAVRPRTILGHVRLRSSGHVGVPDPHPFQHEGAIFVHNGSVPEETLLSMLEADDPDYLDTYPPDWNDTSSGRDDYIDSELYFLLLNKYRREHPELTTAEALRLGVREVAAAAPRNRLNFIMTRGDTLYALRHYNGYASDPVQFYPTVAIGSEQGFPYWVVASQKMGSDPGNWESIPVKTLAEFVPGREPRFYPIDGHQEPAYSFKTITVAPLEDIDDDGWMARFAVTADPDVEWGEASVFMRVLRSADGQTWETLLEASDTYEIHGQAVDEDIVLEFDVTPDTLEATTWDLRLELFEVDAPDELQAVATPDLFPVMGDLPVEGAARDQESDLPPAFSIGWVGITAEVDVDGDGHYRAFRLQWDANYGEEGDSAQVYLKARAFVDMAFRNLGSSEIYLVRGTEADTASLDITVTPAYLEPDTWDLVLDLFHAGPDTIGATVFSNHFEILGDVPIEGEGYDVVNPYAAPAVPNPATGRVVIPLRLPSGGAEVAVEIYDSAGRLMWRHGPARETGSYLQLNWDGQDRSGRPARSGAYFYQARIGEQRFERSFRLVR